MQSQRIAMLSVCLAATLPGQAIRSEIEASQASPASLRMSLLNASRSAIHPNEMIEIQLSRPLERNETVALIAGDTDISAFLERSGGKVWFTPGVVFLSAGEVEIQAYLVTAGHRWLDAGSMRLKIAKVRTPPMLEGGEQEPPFWKFQHSTTIQFRSQPHFTTTSARPFQRTFEELSLQSSMTGRLQGKGWHADMQGNVTGINLQRQAVRYSLLGDAAPQIDLTNYAVSFESKRVKAWLGDQSFGLSRHLLNNFASRGIRVEARFGGRFDLTTALTSGSFIQGYGDPLGFENPENRVLTATLGAEIRRSMPGSARLELTALRGSMKMPFSPDADQSSGIGGRFAGHLWQQRLTWDAGIARSASDGAAHDANYADLSLQILRNVPINRRIKSSWTLTYRGERLDAGFSSVGAFVQPDRSQRQFEASGSIGAFQFLLNHGRFEDNLNRTEFQWKTYTRQTSLTAELPWREFLGTPKNERTWIPRVTYTYFSLRNLSAELPAGMDTGEGLVLPDQRTQAHSLSIDWGRRTRFGYRYSFDSQESYGHVTHMGTYAIQWGKKLDLSGETGIEQTTQLGERSWAARVGSRMKWKPNPRLTVSVNLNGTTMQGTSAAALQGSLDAQAVWKIRSEDPKRRHPRVEWYARYSNRYQSARNLTEASRSFYRTQFFQTGLTVAL